MKQILPKRILQRKSKCGFNERYFLGLRRELPRLVEMVNQSAFFELGIIDRHQLIQVMQQHALGIGEVMSGGRINSVLSLIAWYDQFRRPVQDNSRSDWTSLAGAIPKSDKTPPVFEAVNVPAP